MRSLANGTLVLLPANRRLQPTAPGVIMRRRG